MKIKTKNNIYTPSPSPEGKGVIWKDKKNNIIDIKKIINIKEYKEAKR